MNLAHVSSNQKTSLPISRIYVLGHLIFWGDFLVCLKGDFFLKGFVNLEKFEDLVKF